MEKREVTLPELALIVGTRAMLGAGASLLLADKLNRDISSSTVIRVHRYQSAAK